MTSTELQPSNPLANYTLNGDEDAEYEEDSTMADGGFSADAAPPENELEGSDLDAEGEEVEEEEVYPVFGTAVAPGNDPKLQADQQPEDLEEDVDDDGETVGPVKMPEGQEDEESEEGLDEEAASIDQPSEGSDEDSEKEFTDADSDAEGQWDDGSEAGNDEAELASPNRCIYCGEDEENDPSEDYEEYLACAVCGDNSHRQCARGAGTLTNDSGMSSNVEFEVDFSDSNPKTNCELSEAGTWRCPSCVENALEPDDIDTISQRQSSAPKLTRDLLPAQRGSARPGSHSVFNQLIVNDDPLDGSRLLRKRKSFEEDDEFEPDQRKKIKSSESASESEGSESSSEETAEHEDHAKAEDEVGTRISPNMHEKVVEQTQEQSSEDDESGDEDEEEDDADEQPITRPSRPQRPRKSEKSFVSLVEKAQQNLTLSFRLDQDRLSKIMSTKPKPKTTKKRTARALTSTSSHSHNHLPSVTGNYTTPFYSFHERENDELKSKPYGGILSEADADTSKTLPQATDRERFEEARLKAEEEWKQKQANGMTHGDVYASQKVAGPASKIQCIYFGGFEIDTWYAAPYPEEYSRNRVLYICEFCLKYMGSEYVAWRHKLKCPAKHPPGDEIYREGSVSVFEVDGRKNPVYCQNLCLLAKLFLGSKTLYYDVEPFLFYVMTEYDEFGCHFVGYFSKEKRPSSSNNVSCILTLPTHQRKGYGNLLIDFSYLLTRVEKKTGSPEKPLSDMGLVSYRNYWRLILCYELLQQNVALSITDISDRTGMTADDIVSALEGLRALVRDPVTGSYAFRLDYNYFSSYIEKWEAKNYVRLNPEALVWTPYVMGRSNLAHLEHAPLATVAPREGEEEEEEEKEVGAEEGVQMQTNGIRHDKVNGNVDDEALDHSDASKPHAAAPAAPPAEKGPEQPSALNHSNTNTLPGPPPKTSLTSSQSPSSPPTNKMVRVQPDKTGNRTPSKVPPTPVMPSIPPTRYEIFPALPGSHKRRPGRPLLSGRRRTGTPNRRERAMRSPATGSPAPGGKPLRGKTLFKRSTRSKLQESADDASLHAEESNGGTPLANDDQDVQMDDDI
ncbi:MAG: hypothetical protein M4579_002785 [Chaenotheca gracillima]|nr:MAG: hypothetical protein M4579_002785 [Chaenotheca gracillima]